MGFNLQNLIQQVMQSAQPAIQQATAPQAQAAPQPNWQWAPDHSDMIDMNKYPGAVWRDQDYGGGSEGAPGSAAGFYNYDPGGSDSEGGYRGPSYSPIDRTEGNQWSRGGQLDYYKLRDAGMWDLKDPNSVAWQFLQAKAGNAGDVKTDPNALARALGGAGMGDSIWAGRNEQGRAQLETVTREALKDLNPQFVDQFVPALGQQQMDYWTVSKQSENQGFMKDLGDAGRVYRDMFTQTPLGVAAIAFTGGLSAAGAGGAAAEGAAEGASLGAAAGEVAGAGTEAGVGAFGPGGIEDVAIGGGTGAEGLDLTGFEGFTPNEMGAPQLTDFASPPTGPQGFNDSTLFGEEPGSFAQKNIGTEFNTQSGISPDASQFVNTNPEGQLFDNGGMDQYGYSGEATPETMGAPNPTGKGLLESSLDWANKNPFVAGTALQIGGGLLKGVGDQQTAKDIQERKIQGEKELQAQKTAEQLRLEEERRKKIQAGSYFDPKVNIKPSGQPLRRPDGSLVYPSSPQPLLASRIA